MLIRRTLPAVPRMAFALASIASASFAAATYTVAVLPVPSGLTTFNVFAMNNLGQVVGAGISGTTEEVFIGNTAGMTMIPVPAGYLFPYGYAINDRGQVAGAVTASGQQQAFIGDTAGITLIPFLPGFIYSYGFGINNAGQVAGYGASATAQGFIGTPSGSTAAAVPAGEANVWCYAINASGQMTGYTNNGNYAASQAFIGTATAATAIPSPNGWTAVLARAINASGQVAGFGMNANNKEQAFIGNSSGIAPIPLAAGATNGLASLGSLNDSGIVVGVSDAGAWIWDAANGTRLLNTMVPTGWTVTTGFAINNSGQILADASFGGVASYVILTPAPTFGPCDINQDGKTDVMDVQGEIDEALGGAAPGNDLNSDSRVNVVDVQIVADAAIGLGCTTGGTSTAGLSGFLIPAFRNPESREALAVTATAPAITAVVSAASFQSGPISPGEMVAIGGTDLGPEMPAVPAAGGVQVLFDGTPAALAFVSPVQINCVVPHEVQGKSNLSVQVRYRGQTSNAFPLTAIASNPALFTADGSGAGPAAAVNQDGSYNSSSNPASRGSIVSFFLTGEGRPLLPLSVLVGGRAAELVSYRNAGPGLRGVGDCCADSVELTVRRDADSGFHWPEGQPERCNGLGTISRLSTRVIENAIRR